MKPAQGRAQKYGAGKPRCIQAEPFAGQLVDHQDCPAARYDAQDNEGEVGILDDEVQQTRRFDIKKIARGVRLMRARIEARHGQRKVHRIDVV